ncbi:DUF4265 domain-containing protein [Diaphorobacter sp.]|uniref:DUF4265 domain-containing protein n=1 Tax=Diaphorobacter sp. TaxID=1934310 RepID=UPI003D143AFD
MSNQQLDNGDEVVKVVIEQTYDDTDEVDVECPWAKPLGGNRYQLQNYPFFAYGISFEDIFEAEPKYEDDPRPYVTRVVQKSGHRTLRIFMKESIQESAEARAVLDRLQAMGCGYEGDGAKFFVINVQPHCDFEAVRDYVDSCDIDWEYADPTYETLFPDGDEDVAASD